MKKRFEGEKLKPVSHRTMLGGEAYKSSKHYVMIEPARSSKNWVLVITPMTSTRKLVRKYFKTLTQARKYLGVLGFKL